LRNFIHVINYQAKFRVRLFKYLNLFTILTIVSAQPSVTSGHLHNWSSRTELLLNFLPCKTEGKILNKAKSFEALKSFFHLRFSNILRTFKKIRIYLFYLLVFTMRIIHWLFASSWAFLSLQWCSEVLNPIFHYRNEISFVPPQENIQFIVHS